MEISVDLPPEFEIMIEDKLSEFAHKLFERSVDYADEHTQSGNLKNSLQLIRESPLSWKIGSDVRLAPYSNFVHFGTRPHIIRPKNKKALRWVSNGSFIFAKEVKHPGYIGDPFLHRALRDETDDSFDRIFRGIIQ